MGYRVSVFPCFFGGFHVFMKTEKDFGVSFVGGVLCVRQFFGSWPLYLVGGFKLTKDNYESVGSIIPSKG